jgi:hypothetical protein
VIGGEEDKAAKDYLFSSLTGAVVYGHGKVSRNTATAELMIDRD